MPKIYVTEPDTIDITCAQSILKGTDYELVAGDSHFENASDEYEAVLIRTATQIDSTIKQYFPNLKAVIRVGTGLDNVDLTYCKENGVAIYNAPGANADAVAEYVATMALSALRKLYMLEKSDVEQWDRFKFRGRSIIDVTVGIVGFGNVGRLVYRKLRGMGCHSFLAYDPYLTTEFMESSEGVQAVALDALFSQADVISLHVPLTDETKYTINTQNLPTFKHNAVLINASRGGIVDENALIAHMNNDSEMVYIADAVENEPHVNPALLAERNVIVTPHIASLTSDAEKAMLDLALKNFLEQKAVTVS